MARSKAKRSRNKDLVEISDAELFEQLSEAKAELFHLRFQLATGQLDNTAALAAAKKQVARCLTELRVREIAAAEALEAQAALTEESAR